jgi:hypothetical protein
MEVRPALFAHFFGKCAHGYLATQKISQEIKLHNVVVVSTHLVVSIFRIA